jgi:hypothetical protein
MAKLASLAIGLNIKRDIMSKPRKSAPKKEVVEATPIIERYRPRHTWAEFVALYVPADKYPAMHREYLR